jgi:DNA-binding response OmpR family regulator
VVSEQRPAPVAVVLELRDYPAGTVLSLLARCGYTSRRLRAENLDLERLRHLRAAVILAALELDEHAEVLRRVGREARCPLLAILPRSGQHEQAIALEAGAEACLADDDLPVMLSAQLKAMERRRQMGRGVPALYRVRDLTIDVERFQVIRDGKQLTLSPTEFRIVATLAQHPGRIVSAEDLLLAVSGYTYSRQEAQQLAKVYVRRLRQKLECDGLLQPYIRNFRGAGYMLERRERPRPAPPRVPVASGE